MVRPAISCLYLILISVILAIAHKGQNLILNLFLVLFLLSTTLIGDNDMFPMEDH